MPDTFGHDRFPTLVVILVVAALLALGAPSHAGAMIGVHSGVGPDAADAAPGVAWRVRLDPASIEGPTGRDWSQLDRRLETAGNRDVAMVVVARGPVGGEATWPSPRRGDSLPRFLDILKAAVRRYGDRVRVWEIGELGPDDAGLRRDVASYAFLLKQAALAIRATGTERGQETLVAQLAVPADGADWQAALWAADVAAYIDVLPVQLDPRDGPERLAQALNAWRGDALRHAPAPSVWAHLAGSGDAWDAPAAALTALSAGADAVWFHATDDRQWRWAAALSRVLDEGFAPAAIGGAELDRGAILGRFFDETRFRSAVAVRAPSAGSGATVAARLDVSGDARNVMLDPLNGEETIRLRSSDSGTRRSIDVELTDRPQLVLFERRRAGGLEIDPEQVDVEASRGLTAEEIIARHQALDTAQRERLERWTARGRVDYHARLGPGGSADVTIVSNYFWERGGELEWQEVEYFINGNRVRWKSMPELPLIQPEKVLTLPLDLALDRTYRYRLVGRERVDGRDAYVVSFVPADPDAPLSLYRGRVWIDSATFVRLKSSVIQTRLDAPVLSNEEIDRFAAIDGPDGEAYWMFDRIEGQQTWNVAGRTFVVEREITFDDYRINPPLERFEAERREAYASSSRMLRDTNEGYRYLARDDDGTRSVREGADTTQLFGAVGAFRDASSDGVRPLGGVNWFDYDFRGRGQQVNAFFAGVAGFATASDPELFGSPVDGTVSLTLLGLKFDNEVFVGDVERVEERIETRPQSVSLRVGRPFGRFWRLSLGAALGVRQYFADDEAAQAIVAYNAANPGQSIEFRLPEDHLQLTGSGLVEYNRRGYTVTFEASRSSRSDWEPWGVFDVGSGSAQPAVYDTATARYVADPDPEPLRDSSSRYGLTLVKEWRLPKFQKIRAEVNLLDGDDLDRFSRYQFSLFGEDRLNGFAGTGVRFEQGAIGRLGYSFNLFEAIRFGAVVESALVRERLGAAQASFTGVGVSGNVIGPWKTVISASYGRSIDSEIPDLDGEHEFLVLVLKLF